MCGVLWVADSLPPPPGWRLYMCSRCSGHVADAQVGEIPGYGQPATASGVAMYIAGSGSPHVADAQVGEIPGYARLPPPPGWRKCTSLVICLCLAEMERFVVADSLPPPPGWRFLCASRRPGMSPTPRSAKYPATHGCHHLRVAEMSASRHRLRLGGGGADATLRIWR